MQDINNVLYKHWTEVMQDIKSKVPYKYWTDHKWHEIKLEHSDSTPLHYRFDKCNEVLQWIIENIQGYDKHCRWDMNVNSITVKFRHQKDCFLFALRWS